MTPFPPIALKASSPGCQLVHHIPGRARFRVPQLVTDAQAAAQLLSQLTQVPGIISVRINRAAQALIIQYEPDAAIVPQISDWISQDGATVTPSCSRPVPKGESLPPTARANHAIDDHVAFPKGNCPPAPSSLPAPDTPPDKEGEWASLRLPVTAVALASLSRLSPWQWLRPIAGITVVAAAFPVVQRAWQSVFEQRRLNIDCLDLLALSLSAWQGKLVTPAMVIALHELGDVIREQTARSTAVRTTHLLDAIGRFAWVKVGEQPPQQIASDRVQVGDTVVVYPGEQIPVDGPVIQGEAIVDQQSLTGEAMPVVKRVGDVALASTLVQSGQLYLRAERVGQQTRAAVSIELLQKAPVYDTRMANYAEKVADRLLLPSLLLATIVFIASRDPARAAAILTLDFVTGIRVSIPTAFLSALNHITHHGVLIRSGRTLEQLAEVDTIVFDKTGTLTEGTIAITGVHPVADLSANALLQLAAAAEQRINHPLAAAIVQHAQQQHLAIPSRSDWVYEVGLGIRAQVNGHEVLVGSERFLQQEQVDWGHWLPSGEDASESSSPNRWQSRLYVACDRQLQGVITYRDPLRSESYALIQALQQTYGIEVHLLTGDQAARAAQVAQELGIPSHRVYAEAFPEQKAKIVRDLHRAGRTVAFVGDGLNDSVALAYADVSISFEQGSEIARETADVVLIQNHLLDLLEVIAIARQTRDLIEQNTAIVVVPNLVALGLATTVGLNPLAATAIHNGSAIVAGMNSLRPLLQHHIEQRRSPLPRV